MTYYYYEQAQVNHIMPDIKHKEIFALQNKFDQEKLAVAQHLLKEKSTLVFHGGGGKGRVLPAVFEFLQAYGLKKKPQRVIGISAGCFMALAIALGITEKEDLLRHLKCLPFETFKARTLKRTIRFFIRILGAFFPKWLGYRLKKSFDWAYYDSSGIREYVRKQIVSKFEEWDTAEKMSEYFHETNKKDPTFNELYKKTGVNLELHITVAEEPRTKVYSYLTTPNEKVSLAFQASTSIPGVYPPVEMISGNKAIDGGMSECIKDFEHIPAKERLHIRLLDETASEIYHNKPKYIALPTIDMHIKRLLSLFYNFEYKYFPASEKAVTIAVAVPVDTLHYAWTDEEQADYDRFACEQAFEQLSQMVDLERDNIQKQKLTEGGFILRQYGTEAEMQAALEAEMKAETRNPYVLSAFRLPPTQEKPYVVGFEVMPKLFSNQFKFS